MIINANGTQIEIKRTWSKAKENIAQSLVDYFLALPVSPLGRHRIKGKLALCEAAKTPEFNFNQALEVILELGSATFEALNRRGIGVWSVTVPMTDDANPYVIDISLSNLLVYSKKRKYRAGCLPFGYNADESGQLEVNPAEWKKVMRMKALREEGLSYRRIAEKLKDENIQGRRGFLMFQQVRKILINHAKYSQPKSAESCQRLGG